MHVGSPIFNVRKLQLERETVHKSDLNFLQQENSVVYLFFFIIIAEK